jgi:hypothetical protein
MLLNLLHDIDNICELELRVGMQVSLTESFFLCPVSTVFALEHIIARFGLDLRIIMTKTLPVVPSLAVIAG